jgi:hypothetical protein
VQDVNKSFTCQAFKPVSIPAVSLVSGARPLLNEQKHKTTPAGFKALLNSDRLKYRRALAVQRLQRFLSIPLTSLI